VVFLEVVVLVVGRPVVFEVTGLVVVVVLAVDFIVVSAVVVGFRVVVATGLGLWASCFVHERWRKQHFELM
jgi:hypothetical protein